MIELPAPIESRLMEAARLAGLNVPAFLDNLLSEYLEDALDVKAAELALKEEGEVSHQELKAKYGL
ncbi:hypothetical protein [Methylomonas sp. HYX-M1]|uniref:hypothetical protein n=1 Tax=Methylomonas sp. HYX-M1 TaxID=3139307 RepID=UPI00345B597F